MSSHTDAPILQYEETAFRTFERAVLASFATPDFPMDSADRWRKQGGEIQFLLAGAPTPTPLVTFVGSKLKLGPDGLPRGFVESISLHQFFGPLLAGVTGIDPGTLDINALLDDARFNGSYSFWPTDYPDFFETLRSSGPWLTIGSATTDYMDGLDPGDVLRGRGGYDTFFISSDIQRIDGGRDIRDAVDFYEFQSGVTVRLDQSRIETPGGDGIRVTGVEGVYGSQFRDVIIGNKKANALVGRDGVDTINGKGGEDRIDGGDRADRINGGGGSDRIHGGHGQDQIRGGAGNDGFLFTPENMRGGKHAGVIKDWNAGDKVVLFNSVDRQILDFSKSEIGDDTLVTYRFQHRTSGKEGDDTILIRNTDAVDVEVSFGYSTLSDQPWSDSSWSLPL